MSSHRRLFALLAGTLLMGACSESPTVCDPAALERRGAELAAQAQEDPADWKGIADSILAVAPPDSVLHVGVFLHPQAQQAFVEWAISTGGGYGYAPETWPWDPDNPPTPGPEGRGSGIGMPDSVPGVMIRLRFSSFSGFSIYMPVWALEGLKQQDITGVDFGLGAGDTMLC